MSTGNINFTNNTDDDVSAEDILQALGDQGVSGLKSSDILSLSDDDNSPDAYSIALDHRFSETLLFPEVTERTNIQDLGGTASLSINVGDANVAYQTTATFKMVESGAGYNNTLGAYTVGADGTIKAVEIAFENVKDSLPNGDVAAIDKKIERSEQVIERSEERIEKFTEKTAKFEQKIEDLSTDHPRYEKILARYEAKLERFQSKIEANEERIEKFEQRITKLEGKKADLVEAQEFEYTIDGSEGQSLGMFVIANGDRVNGEYNNLDMEAGELSFVYDLGGENERLAQITDDGADITLIHTHNDVVTTLNGNIFHSTERGAPTNINVDNAQHAVSGLAEEGNNDTLRIGFEDLTNLGDADFNDVVFDVTIEEIEITLDKDALVQDLTISGDDSIDTLIGASGDDVIFGEGGDDILIGNAGRDVLYGGDGGDAFVFTDGAALDTFDVIADFDAAEGDILDISAIVNGFIPGSSNILDWVKITESGGSSYLRVDSDGGRDDFSTVVARIDGVTGMDTTALFNSGTIAITGDQNLSGTIGVDVIYGLDGDDVITGGEGRDVLFGGTGADTFVFEGGAALTEFDVVSDFSMTDGDVLDLTDIVTGFQGGISNIADYISFSEAGGNTFVRVDSDGGRDDFSTIFARLDGVTGLDVFDVFNGEHLAMTGDEIFTGTAGVDVFYGLDGDDVFTGGAGRDVLYGGSGADRFVFDTLGDMDIFRDFDVTEGDALDLSGVITGFDPLTDAIEDFVRITESGENSFLRVDADGGGDDFSTILARIDNTLNLDVEAMFNAGTIAVTGDQIINGTSGVDVIFGLDGDDVINTGAGRDIIFGGAGADTFDFRAGALATFDIVHDFSSSDGDIIDISTIISNFPNDGTGNILDYVRFTEAGEYSYLRVDSNGGRDDFSTIVARLNGTGYDVWDLFFNGQIAVTGDDIYNGARDHVLNSVFYGLDGDDAFSLYHPDREIMDGGSGADTFSFLDNSNYNRTFDIIRGFDANEGDVLKLENVVSYSDPIEDIINDFVRITEAGGNSFVRVDQTGNGIFNAVDIRLDGVTGLNVQDLLENGNIIV